MFEVSHYYLMADPDRLVMFAPDASTITVNWDQVVSFAVREVGD